MMEKGGDDDDDNNSNDDNEHFQAVHCQLKDLTSIIPLIAPNSIKVLVLLGMHI